MAEAGVGALSARSIPLRNAAKRLPIRDSASSKALGEDLGRLFEQHLDRGPDSWGRVKLD